MSLLIKNSPYLKYNLSLSKNNSSKDLFLKPIIPLGKEPSTLYLITLKLEYK